MNNEVYNFKLIIDWKLINLISEIDRFDANWTAIERKEGQSLKELKSIATVRSVGASNRIEGNRMSDEEVDVLLQIHQLKYDRLYSHVVSINVCQKQSAQLVCWAIPLL